MKKILSKHNHLIVLIISYLYIILFVYTAISKLLGFESFRIQLAQSPLLSAWAGLIAPSVIIAELLIVLLLCFKTTRLAGLYASLFLMVAFTVYIYIILHFSDFIPCSCGGFIEQLSWTQHMVFNIAFALLAIAAVVLTEKEKNTPAGAVVLRSLLPSLVAAGIVVALFLSSEHIIKKENNFIRRFGQHPVIEDKVYDLGYDSYYFAGITGDTIYLGNVTAPLLLTIIDTALTAKSSVKIHLDSTDHPFRYIQVKVQPPWFYLYDGNVPVIYRGRIGDTIARTVSLGDCYFSQLKIIDSANFAFRAQSSKTKTQVLGTLSLNREPKVTLNDALLEKQVDGMFDTDGQLLLDEVTGELIYIYLYRNEFLVMESDLTLLLKLHTIDTITRAQVKVQTLSGGQHKMISPPLKVNKISAVYGRVLFNESNLMGKYESQKMWEKAAIIDMYRTGQQEYLGSFYIHNRGKNSMSKIFVTKTHLYVLCGNEIVRYRFARAVTNHFKTGEAENLEQSRQ